MAACGHALAVATLFAVGWVVAQMRMQTGALWAGIGLHGGWVFGLKYFTALTITSEALNRGETLPWIGSNLKIGLAPFATVLFTGFMASLLFRSRQTSAINNR